MNVGALRNKITIKKQTRETDEYGQRLDQWDIVKKVWAAIIPALGRNYYTADQTQTDAKTKIVTRYHPEITRDMRIFYGNRVYDIIDIQDVNMRHQELVIYCKEVTNEYGYS